MANWGPCPKLLQCWLFKSKDSTDLHVFFKNNLKFSCVFRTIYVAALIWKGLTQMYSQETRRCHWLSWQYTRQSWATKPCTSWLATFSWIHSRYFEHVYAKGWCPALSCGVNHYVKVSSQILSTGKRTIYHHFDGTFNEIRFFNSASFP